MRAVRRFVVNHEREMVQCLAYLRRIQYSRFSPCWGKRRLVKLYWSIANGEEYLVGAVRFPTALFAIRMEDEVLKPNLSKYAKRRKREHLQRVGSRASLPGGARAKRIDAGRRRSTPGDQSQRGLDGRDGDAR